jgi:hypothetical protein
MWLSIQLKGRPVWAIARLSMLTTLRWRQIEKAYGSPLPPAVRGDLVRATEAFVFLQSIEGTPERKAKVKVILEAHDKAATRFFNELFSGASATSDAGVYAHFLIEANFKSPPLRGKVIHAATEFLRPFQ